MNKGSYILILITHFLSKQQLVKRDLIIQIIL